MNAVALAQVASTFGAFHQTFAPLFGRREAQARSEQYVRGLLVQPADRRNAENLAEAPWDHVAGLTALQAHLAARLNEPEGVFVLAESGGAKQGTQSVGVARQYCGTLGQVGHCQLGVFLAYVSTRGHALVDARLYLPRAWTDDPGRCRAAGVPAAVTYQSKAELGLALVRQARTRGHLQGQWVTADEDYGKVPSLRDALDAEDWWYVLAVPATTPVFTAPAATAVPAWSGRGRQPTQPRLVAGAPRPLSAQAVAASRPAEQWPVLTVADGAQGPRTYAFAAQRVWESRAGLPGRACWLVLRRNRDGTEPKQYRSKAPADTPLLTLARVGAWRWPIETDFEDYKQQTGLDEYEVRSWRGWQHHLTLALLAGAFLLTLQQDWGGNPARLDPPPSQPRPARVAAAAPVDARRPAALVGDHAAAQRPRQSVAHQAPSRSQPFP